MEEEILFNRPNETFSVQIFASLARFITLYFLLRPQSEGNAIHLASRQDSKMLENKLGIL